MASYLPNHQGYIPQLEPFTPDYKFLSDVLQKRQDRYDRNYNAINNLYGQVVYAPLTRDDNKEKRDQYANDISNSLKQVSGLDLSLQQNVETAKALFKPFYEDDKLVEDLFRTRRYKEEMKNMNDMKNSSIKARRDNYWTYGDRFLQQNMNKFKTLSESEAYKLPMPEYVKNPNLFEEGQRLLSDPNLDGDTSDAMVIEYTDLEGDYIITYKNGQAMTNFPYIDENGDTKYKNWGTEWLAQALQDDPKIQRGYYVMGQVISEDWIQDNLNEFGGNRVATQKAWDDKILKEALDMEIVKLSETETALFGASLSAEGWEDYKASNGIVEGTAEAEILDRKRYELKLAQDTRNKLNNRILNQKAPTDDEQSYHQKALNAFMSMKIGEDMNAAAIKYAQGTSKRDIKPNDAVIANKRMIFDQAEREANNAFKWDLEEQKHQNALELQKLKNEGKDGTTNKNSNSQQITSLLDDIVLSGNLNLTGVPTEENPNQIGSNFEALQGGFVATKKMKLGQINLLYNNIKLAQQTWSGSSGAGYIELSLNGGKKKAYTLEEAMVELLKPENSSELDRLYEQAKKWTNETDEVETENGNVTFQRFSPDDPGWNMYIGDDPNTEEKEGTPLRILLATNEMEIMGNTIRLPQILTDYKLTMQKSFRYLKGTNSGSEYAINARNGYLDRVAPVGVISLMQRGISVGDLYAPEDAVRPDGSSHWEWVENQLKSIGMLKTDDQIAADGQTGMSLRQRIHSTELDYLNDTDYRNFMMLSLEGFQTGGKNSDGSFYTDDNGNERMRADLNKYFWDDTEGAYQHMSLSGWNSLRGEVWKFDKKNGWYFDSIEAQNLINKHMEIMDNDLNMLWSGDQAHLKENGIPYPTVVQDVFMLDNDELGSGLMVYPQSNTLVDTRSLSTSASENLEGVIKAYQAPDATTIIAGGDFSTEFPEDTTDDQIAKQILGIILGETRKGLNTDLESGQTSYNLLWTQAGGGTDSREDRDGDGIDEYYSLYQFDFMTEEGAKLLQRFKNITGTTYVDGKLKNDVKFEDSDLYKTGKLSVLVEQEFDKFNNTKNLMSNRPDGMALLINEIDQYEPNAIPNGGKMIAYKGANGQIMLKTESQFFNPISGNIEWDPGLITTRVIDPQMVAAEIAQTLYDLQILSDNNKLTQDAWKKFKLAEAENEKNNQ
jgi:hypothetical protein